MAYEDLFRDALGGADWDWMNPNGAPGFLGYQKGYMRVGQPTVDFGFMQPRNSAFGRTPDYSLGEGVIPQMPLFPKVIPDYGQEYEPTPSKDWLSSKAFPPPQNYAPTETPTADSPPRSRGDVSPLNIGLLAAGLGILGNNIGHYGAFGPAVGRGGLVGLSAYGEERDRLARQRQLDENSRLREEQLKINRQQADYVGRKMDREGERDREMTRLRSLLRMAKTPEARQQIVEEMIAVAGDPDSLIKQFASQKGERPFLEDIGVPGKPNLRQKALVTTDGKVTPIGEPYEMSKGVEVNVGKGDDSFDKSLNEAAAKEVVTQAAQARGAAQTIQTTNKILEALDSGKVLAGPGTPIATTLLQVGRYAGIGGKDADEVLTNTRTAMQSLAQLELDAAQQLKGQGQITEGERAIVARAAAGKINELTTPELRTLVSVLQKTARWKIAASNRTMEGLKGRGPAAGVLTVPEPPEYTRPPDPEQEDKAGPWTRYRK